MRKLTILFLFLVSVAQAQTNIEKIEYWIDVDPGFDSATVVTGLTSASDAQLAFNIPANLSTGIHTFGIRSKDSNGRWSQTNYYPVNIIDSSNGEIVEVEYFWDIDPGFGYGIDSLLSAPNSDIMNGLFTDSVPMSFLLGSSHILFERSKDSRGRWSHTNYVDSMVVIGTVSLNELAIESGVNIYPNPFFETLTVFPQNKGNVQVVLYDGSGKKVVDTHVSEETKINTQNLSAGSYTIFVCSDKKVIYKAILLKQ